MSFNSSRWKPTSSLIAAWAACSPSRRSSSGTSTAPPSTIVIASSDPATTRSTSEYSSCWKVGFTIHVPWIRPTRTEATRVRKGICDMLSATEAPSSANTSASFSWSALRMLQMICVSFMNPSGNNGRIGRSIERAARISFSPGRPSRLKNPPGILPAAYVFSRYSTVKGKKGRCVGFDCTAAVQSTIVSPNCTRQEPGANFAILPTSSTSFRPANCRSSLSNMSTTIVAVS